MRAFGRVSGLLVATWLLVAAPALEASPVQTGRSKAAAARIESRGQELLAGLVERGLQGATAALVLPDGTTVSFAAGSSGRTDQSAMTPEHRLLAGSVGKTFVTAAAHLLAHEGLLDLDRTAASYFEPDPPEWVSRIPNGPLVTLRQLLQHTSGIPRHIMKRAFAEALQKDLQRRFEPEELLGLVFDDEPLFEPGEGFSYADTNYVVVGLVIEQVSEGSFYDLVQDRFLDPLELVNTLPADNLDLPGMANGTVETCRFLGVPERTLDQNDRFTFNPQFEWCGGGFASTPTDLARWAGLLYSGQAFQGDYLSSLLNAREAPELGPGVAYGLGAMLRDTKAGRLVGHEGVMPGYLTTMGLFPDAHISAAVQINTDNPRAVGQPLTGTMVDLVKIAQAEFDR